MLQALSSPKPARAAESGEVERVARALLERIVAGEYPSGLRLPAEVDLAKQLACGRSTIREALTRLSTLGVVASRRGSGAHVLDWRRFGTPALLPFYLPQAAAEGTALILVKELLGMRRLLAKEAVRLAVRYGKDDALGSLRDMFEASLEVSDPVAHVALELEIFRGLVVSSALWPAVWFANSFWVPLRELHQHFAPLAGGPPPNYASSMDRLLTLVMARKEKQALEHVDHYLAQVDRHLLSRLEEPTRAADKRAPTAKKAKRP